MNELPQWNNDATFITLTYNDDNLPVDFGLHKEDVQKFFKRLRKDFIDLGWYRKDINNRKIANLKYFACGEYGDERGRPHYHAIVFGLPYNSVGRQLVKDNWKLCDLDRFDYNRYKHKEQGFAPVSPDDIRYVCGYVQKKYNGKLAEQVYGDRARPFQLQSQGLGLDFALKHREEIENGSIKFRGHNVAIPRYYLKKLNIESSGSSSREHKIEWLQEHGYNVPNEPSKQFIVDYAYAVESEPYLRANARENDAHLSYRME